MKWEERPPEPLGKKPNPGLAGPHASGKTEALIQTVKSLDCTTLVIATWPWELARWKDALGKKKGVILHTPESLARKIIEKLEQWSGKQLTWKVQAKIVGMDPESQARNLLKEKTLTADTAHWLLRGGIPDLLQWKKPVDVLALDNPDEWDPDVKAWINQLPHLRRIETRFQPGSTWLPGKSATPKTMRWLKAEHTSEGAGQWVIHKTESQPGKKRVLIIQTEKEKWQDYLGARGINVEIRHASECEGRFWDEALIPNLRQNWGSPNNARKWIDLVASRCLETCICRIHPTEQPSWIPRQIEGKPYLVWKPEP